MFVDPKKVEFSTYRKLLHHYLATIPGAANAEEEAERIIVNDQASTSRRSESTGAERSVLQKIFADQLPYSMANHILP